MTSPGLPPWARPLAAVGFRETRRRLAYVRQQEQELPQLRGSRREVAARTCERRRETRLQLLAIRQLLHALFGSSAKKGPGSSASFALALPVDPLRQKDTRPCTLHHHQQHSKSVCSHVPMNAPPGSIVSPCTA